MTTARTRRTHVLRIHGVTRAQNSTNGNPRYTVVFVPADARVVCLHTPRISYITAPDRGWAYAMGNVGYRAGDVVTIELDGRDRIVTMTPSLPVVSKPDDGTLAAHLAEEEAIERRPRRRFVTRDIGCGAEEGYVRLPAVSEPDWAGKREYRTPDGDTVFLFDDELR